MKIVVVGASGMVGSRVVAEAAQRGHEVIATSRSGEPVSGAETALALELTDTAALVAAIDAADVAVIAVPTDRAGQSHEPVIDAHRALIAAHPTRRVIVVGGAGSLLVDGVTLKDVDGFPAEYKAEAESFTTILDLYRASSGINWTVLSPSPIIAPGERTGHYLVGGDSPVGNSISAEDFAVALVDEIEEPTHVNARFTVAN